MGPNDDAEAIHRCQRGDLSGLEALVSRYQVPAVRLAYLLTQDRALAEDMVQDAFLLVAQKCGQFREGASFAPWFHRIVINLVRQHMRSATRRHESSLDAAASVAECLPSVSLSADPSRSAEQAERSAAVLSVLRTLTQHQREVLVLHFYCGYSHPEMSAMLGSPQGTLRWRLHAALRAFEESARATHPWLVERSDSLVAITPREGVTE